MEIPEDLRELYERDIDGSIELSAFSLAAADLTIDLTEIKSGRINQFDNRLMNLAEISYELQLIAPTIALYLNAQSSLSIDHEKVAELACVSQLSGLHKKYVDQIASRDFPDDDTKEFAALLPASLAGLLEEYEANQSPEARFLHEVAEMLDNPSSTEAFTKAHPEYELDKLLKSTHTYIHSTETTRVPLLNPTRHENNAEHSVENALFGICARDYIVATNPQRAKEFDELDDESFRYVAWYQAIHDLPELITGDVQTCTTSDDDIRAKELVEASVAPLLGITMPQIVAKHVRNYEKREGVFRQGFARMIDKLGPGALDTLGRKAAGRACMGVYGIHNPNDLRDNDIRLARKKNTEFGERQPELIGAYVVQMAVWLEEFNAQFTESPERFTPNIDGRIPGHENCLRCEMNDRQGANVRPADFEQTPQSGAEREKKYIVAPEAVSDLREALNDPVEIMQVYLSDKINLRVRRVVDINGKKIYLATLKGSKSVAEHGKVVRHEVECEITEEVFRAFQSRDLPHIEKTRYRNSLLPAVTLDMFKDVEKVILESEDVTGISPLRRSLIGTFQESFEHQHLMTQSTGDEVDNQQIALAAFGNRVADYIDHAGVLARVFSQADEAAQQHELLRVMLELAA
jgi:5'-deoxynucleotidase YfbR-like HD superfamily hydrolase